MHTHSPHIHRDTKVRCTHTQPHILQQTKTHFCVPTHASTHRHTHTHTHTHTHKIACTRRHALLMSVSSLWKACWQPWASLGPRTAVWANLHLLAIFIGLTRHTLKNTHTNTHSLTHTHLNT